MTALTVLLSASPEIIRLVSTRRAAAAMASSGTKVMIDIADMGCEACRCSPMP